MAEEVRFKQIAATTWSTGHANSHSQVRLFGLTEEGLLYEWMEQKRAWGRLPMDKLPDGAALKDKEGQPFTLDRSKLG